MGSRGIILFLFVTIISSIFCLNLEKLSNECLKNRSLHEEENLNCESLKGVAIHRIQHLNQTFYCIEYEKRTGEQNEFDVLSFDLHEDYSLKYVKYKEKYFAKNFNFLSSEFL